MQMEYWINWTIHTFELTQWMTLTVFTIFPFRGALCPTNEKWDEEKFQKTFSFSCKNFEWMETLGKQSWSVYVK